jgi:hypothetical protein
MPILLGLLIGGRLGWQAGHGLARLLLSHAALTLFLWAGVAWTGYALTKANVGPTAAPYAAVTAPAALSVWMIVAPAKSRAKLWLIDGLYIWTRLGIVVVFGVGVYLLLHDGGRLAVWLRNVWPLAIAGGVLWAAQRGIFVLLRRSHLAAGDRSLIGE